MPKLTIELDTDSQECSVKVNGTDISNVNSVSLYNWNYDVDSPKFVFEVVTYEKDDGVNKYTRLTASEKDGKASASYDGLFVASLPEKMTKAQRDIVALMSRGRSI